MNNEVLILFFLGLTVGYIIDNFFKNRKNKDQD